MSTAAIRPFLDHIETERLVLSDPFPAQHWPDQILWAISRTIGRVSSVNLFVFICQYFCKSGHKLLSCSTNEFLGIVSIPDSGSGKGNRKGLILFHCPACCKGGRPCKGRKVSPAIPKSLKDQPKLIKMEFCPKLSFNIFNAQGIDKGNAVPNIENGKPMETKISESGDRIVVSLWCRCLSNAFPPVLFGRITREVSTMAKD